jgi:hypothetical protein
MVQPVVATRSVIAIQAITVRHMEWTPFRPGQLAEYSCGPARLSPGRQERQERRPVLPILPSAGVFFRNRCECLDIFGRKVSLTRIFFQDRGKSQIPYSRSRREELTAENRKVAGEALLAPLTGMGSKHRSSPWSPRFRSFCESVTGFVSVHGGSSSRDLISPLLIPCERLPGFLVPTTGHKKSRTSCEVRLI